jgi:type VII secretion-associated serine protease mycosin
VRLIRDGSVADVRFNYLRYADSALNPNDPLFVQGYQNYLKSMRLPDAWGVYRGSSSYKVAVVDTGVDLDHPDLSSRINPGYDFINNDSSADDDNGHGTVVAGIATAITNNRKGVAGAAWRGGIIPVKVLDATGVGTDATVASGITWAADHGAKVINLSLGGPADSPVLSEAVDYAAGKGVVLVASAGNDGSNAPSYPAAYSRVLAVSATDRGYFDWFSNYGWWVDVAAPGINITGTYPAAGAQEEYAQGSGTSFSAALVSGLVLLVRAKNPTWSRSKVVSRILSTAQDYGPRGIDPFFGWGRVDAYAALGGAKRPSAAPTSGFDTNSSLDRATPLTTSSTTGSIFPEGDTDWYSTIVTTPGSVTFTVTPPPFNANILRQREMDPVLDMYGPDLRALGEADQAGPGETETITVPAATAGRYYVQVHNFSGSRSPGSYTLTSSSSTDPAPPRFGRHQDYVLGAYPTGMRVADVTGDGRDDLLVSTGIYLGPKSFKLFVYPQQSGGSLGAPTEYPIDSGQYQDPAALAIGDLNGDGKIDAAVAAAKGVDVFVQATGGLTGPSLIPLAPTPFGVEIADMNSDGRQDIVVQTDSSAVLLQNTRSGFTATTIINEVAPGLQAADMTGDGRPDLVSVDIFGSPPALNVFAQQSDGSFSKRSQPLPDDVRAMLVADVTADGRDDVLVSTLNPPSLLQVLAQSSSGGLGSPVNYPVENYPDGLAPADFNVDGRVDIFISHEFREFGIMLQRPDGTLGVESIQEIPFVNTVVEGLGVGDVTGDSLPDVIVEGPDPTSHNEHTLFVLAQLSSATGPPVGIRNTSPVDFATRVSRIRTPVATFGLEVDGSTISASHVYIRDGTSNRRVSTVVSYNTTSRTVAINPSSTLRALHPYIVFVDGVTDSEGNVLPLFTFRFMTRS